MQVNKTIIVLAVASAVGGSALAGVSADEAKKLGTTLTAVGAEKGANKDGSIPAYTGGLTTVPTGFKPGDGLRPDPFAGEKPLFSIDGKTADKYADKLTEGTKALMKKYPDYRIDVYKTHRTVAMPKFVEENTAKCAVNAKTTNGGRSMEGCHAGFPFPIPKTGFEAMWNHLVRFQGVAYSVKYRNWNIDASGRPSVSTEGTIAQEFPYWDTSKPDSGVYFKQRINYTGPARRAGEAMMLIDPLDYAEKDRRAWLYLPGQRRVKVAPDLSHDTPNPGTGGTSTFDDVFLFLGSMDRFDFKLVGKKEAFIPYNDYRMAYNSTKDELLKPKFLNPDVVRWEQHRVWVVEATLREGKRHVYSKRTFYLDEDSWAAVASESYDARGQLFRTGFSYLTPSYEVPAPFTDMHGFYDLIAGSYSLSGYTAETGGVRPAKPAPDRDWSPDALAGSGIR
ncbi:DUF1329 domain-containing protein [Alicycliphilus denitrificans]|uniref:DUF1329 domain-containing protein n=1 Tax=Alicycliphilus denitrificans (strain DSM 14773 / CIP 107495 / K601) TaxID=596154 RepID=F4GFV8_ALIDK|nr:DUF1329 domain-containing protein [Alicycliphilus denitrificans]AEB86194.1 protein of unknown function DUF1329 [Alicycliphilus denitrificans K601]